MTDTGTAQSAGVGRLTALLRRAGALRQGTVQSVASRPGAAMNSQLSYLEVTYTPDAPPDAPPRLVLKLDREHHGAAEVGFYNQVAAVRDELPMLPRCYAAAYSPQSGDSYCLLEDLSATHAPVVVRERLLALDGVPPVAQLELIMDALAAFHAYWWEHPLLGRDFAEVRVWYRDEAHHARHLRRRQTELAAFNATVGAWFSDDLRTAYTQILARLPLVWDRMIAHRVASRANLTLSHGDCYLTQPLCPIPGVTVAAPRRRAYLVDFQEASANFGAFDLVYLFATFWTSAQRSGGDLEERLLRRYHRGLETGGVRGFSWDDLLMDYGLMTIYVLFDPVWNQTQGSSRDYWWPKMQCLMAAFDDLGCDQFLE